MRKLQAAMTAAVISISIAMVACGGKVVVDASGSTTGTGGAGGASSDPAPCPGQLPLDQEIEQLLGKPCLVADQVCASNNGCGGCSVTCKGGIWTSTDASLCYSIGGTC